MDREPPLHPDAQRAFLEHDLQVRVKNLKIGCILVITLMPVGFTLDYFVYPEYLWYFLIMRLLCSLLTGIIYFLLLYPFGKIHIKTLSMIIPMLPTIFISWMIYKTEGSSSPYYAGLNLVLVAVGFVVFFTFKENLIFQSLLVIIYLGVIFSHWTIYNISVLFSNLYFITLTIIIVITGSYFHRNLFYREFINRFELDRHRRELSDQKQALETTLKQLKDTEAQLVQTEKMASLGRWSAGLIHEINNPLNFTLSALYVLIKKCKLLPEKERPAFNETIHDIEEGMNRIKETIAALKSFAHPAQSQLDWIELRDIIDTALRFLMDQWKDRVRIEIEILEGERVWGNKNGLIHVFVNMIQNALDALRKKRFEREEPTIWIECSRKGEGMMLKIRDNGKGIKQENINRIFDPFFTTKDVGEGMGLGLGICYRIIQQHGWTISVRSEPERFSEFLLQIPLKPQGQYYA